MRSAIYSTDNRIIQTPASQGATTRPIATTWPNSLAEAAFHGVAGEVVRAIDPHTESDIAALLIQTLLAFGNAIGRTAYFKVEADRHYGNLFVTLVGATSKARKGTSWGHIKGLFKGVDSVWATDRIISGLSSGEGIIWAVRDSTPSDLASEDRRTLVMESEFAAPLRVMARDGNTLSAVLRDAWDMGDLGILTKNFPARATGAHISLLSHCTRDDLLRYLSSTEAGNGFANRFLWVCVQRSKMLPEGGHIEEVDFAPVILRLREAMEFARNTGEIRRDAAARDLWASTYATLSEGKPGLLGSVTSRAEAQVVRLSLLYALLDCSQVIRLEHLQAALAVWNYCDSSAKFIFGDDVGGPGAYKILSALRAAAGGLTRTEIRDLFGRHKTAEEINSALVHLSEQGLAQKATETTDGRSIERWYVPQVATQATEAT